MPFNEDIRAGLFSVELNISSIVEELENLVEKTLISQDYEKGGVVWKYVYDLENAYSAHMNYDPEEVVSFWHWFTNNYNNVYSYNDLIWEKEIEEKSILDREKEILDKLVF